MVRAVQRPGLAADLGTMHVLLHEWRLEDLSDDEFQGGVSLQSLNARPTIFFGRQQTAHGVPLGLDEWHLAATSVTRCFDEDSNSFSAFTGIGRHEVSR